MTKKVGYSANYNWFQLRASSAVVWAIDDRY